MKPCRQKCLQSTIIYLIGQTGFTMTDIGEGPGLFLDQTEAQRAKNNFGETASPPHQRVWMTGGAPLSQGLDPALLKKLLFKSNIL